MAFLLWSGRILSQAGEALKGTLCWLFESESGYVTA